MITALVRQILILKGFGMNARNVRFEVLEVVDMKNTAV
jgi:hypothetical protein